MSALDAVLDATHDQPPLSEQYVDATIIVNDIRRDLRRLRRCIAVQSVMLAIVLTLNLIAPLAVILSR